MEFTSVFTSDSNCGYPKGKVGNRMKERRLLLPLRQNALESGLYGDSREVVLDFTALGAAPRTALSPLSVS
jgi:hypothetical protein